jgi:hypothetical protein
MANRTQNCSANLTKGNQAGSYFAAEKTYEDMRCFLIYLTLLPSGIVATALHRPIFQQPALPGAFPG